MPGPLLKHLSVPPAASSQTQSYLAHITTRLIGEQRTIRPYVFIVPVMDISPVTAAAAGRRVLDSHPRATTVKHQALVLSCLTRRLRTLTALRGGPGTPRLHKVIGAIFLAFVALRPDLRLVATLW